MNFKIKLTFLHVEKGEEIPVTFTEETSGTFMATVIKSLTDNGHILTDVNFIKKETEE